MLYHRLIRVPVDRAFGVVIFCSCETPSLHTVPHSLTAPDATDGASYAPNISTNFPFMSHASAEDPMVWIGLGRIATLYCRSSTLYQVH